MAELAGGNRRCLRREVLGWRQYTIAKILKYYNRVQSWISIFILVTALVDIVRAVFAKSNANRHPEPVHRVKP